MRPLLLLGLLSTSSFAQVITTIAGNGTEAFGGDGGPATAAWINRPNGVAVDGAGNITFADTANIRVRKVNTAGVISTLAGDGTIKLVITGQSLGDGGPATSAGFSPSPSLFQGIAVDTAGNTYISDGGNRRIRKVNPQGIISTFAGGGPGLSSGGDGGLATNASFSLPSGVAVDNEGNVYIADPPAGRIRKVNPAGVISTVAGSGSITSSGDGGPATQAGIGSPLNVAVDNLGNLYLTEQSTFRVRKVNAAGIITTVAGSTIGFSGDGGPATQAAFGDLRGLAADSSGNLYIADYGNNRVRKVDAAGIVTTIAGIGTAGIFLENGDGGLPSNSRLTPGGLALDAAGNLYISDYLAGRVRKINFTAPAPGLSLSAWTMNFASIASSSPAAQTIKVSSAGPPLGFRVTTTSNSPSIGPWMTASTATGTTPQSFTISIRGGLDPGTYQGTITVTPTVAGHPPVTATVNVTIVASAPPRPVITRIVNGASFQAGLSPNSIYTIQGTNLASTTDTWDRFIVGGKLPTSLGGVIVTIGNLPVYITYISPTQINFIAPDIGIIFSSAFVNNNGALSANFPIQATQYGPAFFTWPGSQVVATRPDYTFAVKNGTFGTSIAAKPGDVLILWGTGFGPTSPLTLPGSVVPSDRTYSTTTAPTVTINNVPALVYGAALASGFVGLYQIAIQVPASIPNGDWPIVASIGGAQSPTTVLLSVSR